LAGVLRNVASAYLVQIAPTNGQCGGFLRTDVAPLLSPGQRVGYLGDQDLCGGQIEANTRKVLEELIGDELCRSQPKPGVARVIENETFKT